VATVDKLELTNLTYCRETATLDYTFRADGTERRFTATSVDDKGIRGISLPTECQDFLVSTTNDVPRLMQAIVRLTLRCVDGVLPELPVRLV
jgi:hypothetical protein